MAAITASKQRIAITILVHSSTIVDTVSLWFRIRDWVFISQHLWAGRWIHMKSLEARDLICHSLSWGVVAHYPPDSKCFIVSEVIRPELSPIKRNKKRLRRRAHVTLLVKHDYHVTQRVSIKPPKKELKADRLKGD